MPLTCLPPPRLPQPPPFDLSAPKLCNATYWTDWPVYTNDEYKLADHVTHPDFLPQMPFQQQSHPPEEPPAEEHPLPPEWETSRDANGPHFCVNHGTRRSTYERPIPVTASVLWQL